MLGNIEVKYEMKKILAITIAMALLCSFSACASNATESADPSTDTLEARIDELESENAELKEQLEELQRNSPVPSSSVSQVDESTNTVVDIGTKSSLGDWNITIDSFEWTDSIAADYAGSFKPDDGNQFAVVHTTVYNAGKSADIFLPSYSSGADVKTKVLYGDGYEFSSSSLLGYSRDLHDTHVNPLSTTSGVIVFEIPNSVVDDSGDLFIEFSASDCAVRYQLR